MKKTISSILSCLLLISVIPTAVAAPVNAFTDVNTGDWFYGDVSFVTEKQLFNGTSTNTFSPDLTMERGMFVTVLGRYANAKVSVPKEGGGIITKSDVRLRNAPTTVGSQTLATLAKDTMVDILDKVPGTDDPSYSWYYVNYNGTLGYVREDLMKEDSGVISDVPSDAYYANYVYWALNTGIAAKTGENTFSPTRAITREELCSMMYNYAKNRNLEIWAVNNVINFTDAASISPTYSAAVSAMQKGGIVNGYTDGSFMPKGSATRAEVSAMLTRFIKAITYKPANEPSYDSNGSYIWGNPLPEKQKVGSEFFSDSCFIGHSLVVGMKTYFGLPGADFYAFNGAGVRSLLNHTGFAIPDGSGNAGKLSDCLGAKNYGKVYIMLGANEIGTAAAHSNTFYNNMLELINLVRASQPNAAIYLMSFTPVSQSCSESRADLSRDNIIKYNDVIKRLCKEKRAYYLNVFDALQNGDGFLDPNTCTSDGIHFYASEYAKIKNYIFSHTTP